MALTPEENDLLCRVGRGTPMGEMMRRYWVPACLSEELPEPDCDPIRLRVLGEDLIAFRDTEGRAGVMQERCPHRGASLFFGRNEEGGLRCLYHGWKMDVEGNVLETPCEPAESRMRFHIKHEAYPVVEQGDVGAGDTVETVSRPSHPVTIGLIARLNHADVNLARLMLQAARLDLDPEEWEELLTRGGVGTQPA